MSKQILLSTLACTTLFISCFADEPTKHTPEHHKDASSHVAHPAKVHASPPAIPAHNEEKTPHATTPTKKHTHTPAKKEPVKKVKPKSKPREKIWFRYKDEPLIDIISTLAKKQNINIVLPTGKEAIVNKLTFQYPEKITVSDAWRRVLSILKICGYSIGQEGDLRIISGADPKRFKDANRQPYPLYSHIKPGDLPDSDEKIRYIHYFSNLQVGSGGGSSRYGGGGGGNGILPLIQALLSQDATIVTDPSSNGLVITDYARNISSALHIITELDSHGFTDAIDFIQLKHTAAETVAKLFLSLINSNAPQQRSQYGGQGQSSLDDSQSQYFAKSTRIVAEGRTNSLILMGKKDALKQARSFIEKNIDIPLGTGESILHIYDLQYLKASEFQPVLQSIVSSSGGQQGSQGTQSSGSVKNNSGEQYFEGVIIAAEATGGGQQQQSQSYGGSGSGSVATPAQAPQTSNRLVIAARNQDWIRIKKLIEELDKPQLQVAIEALIVDLSLTSNKRLASQMRNKSGLNIKNTNFQTSNVGSIVLDNNATTQNADALMANLLNMANTAPTVPSGTHQPNQASNNILSGSPAGSLLLSFKDQGTNGMWLVTQLLSNFKDIKVLSQPFIVALNNQDSSFQQSDSRFLPGETTSSLGGAVQQNNAQQAILGINVKPLISNGGKVNLGIVINVQEYGTSTEVLTRKLQTNANINDGEVLVLGGLTKTKVVNGTTGTPGLQHIPLFGWMFKKKTKVTIKEHLLIFLCPRIIHTTPGKYFDPYTKNKMLNMNKILAEGENFDTLKDPITHWFFGSPASDVATKRIHAFKERGMYSSNQDYSIDKQRAGVKTITVNPDHKVDHKTVMKTTGHIAPPSTIKKENPVKATANNSKIKKPTKTKHIAQVSKQQVQPKVALSEEEELKRLFATLDTPIVA